jgi:hypothetical protein
MFRCDLTDARRCAGDDNDFSFQLFPFRERQAFVPPIEPVLYVSTQVFET